VSFKRDIVPIENQGIVLIQKQDIVPTEQDNIVLIHKQDIVLIQVKGIKCYNATLNISQILIWKTYLQNCDYTRGNPL